MTHWKFQFTKILNYFQNEKLNQVVAKLDQLTNMNKKQDLLDMELEEAESRFVQLTYPKSNWAVSETTSELKIL